MRKETNRFVPNDLKGASENGSGEGVHDEVKKMLSSPVPALARLGVAPRAEELDGEESLWQKECSPFCFTREMRRAFWASLPAAPRALASSGGESVALPV